MRGQENENLIKAFMQRKGAEFGIPDEFRDETPEESIIFDGWEGDEEYGKE
ncbi:MAG: hypothetical protein NC293_03030 [Roseburia sp.]|nr:hypothetical protein [Roseburia sp.]